MTRSFLRVVMLMILALVPLAGVVAEDTPPWEVFPEALGGYYGPFSGSGLHYHRWIGEAGFHVTAGIIYVPFDSDNFWFSNTTLDYAAGGEYQRRVYGEAFTNWLAGSLFLFAGAQHRGYIPVELVAEGYEVPDSDPVEYVDPVYEVGSFQAEFSVGAGIGVELILFRHFSIPLEFGYGGRWTVTNPDITSAISIGPNVQTGLRYRY